MVFSFFKKPDVKMPAPVSARVPKAKDAADGDLLEPPDKDALAPKPAPAKPSAAETEWSFELEDTNTRVNGGYGVEILEGGNPYVEVGEHAAIAYANGQNDVARSTLESAIQDTNDPEALKLWHMLFDLFRVTGDQAAFDALGAEFARTCELSPPSWVVKSSEVQAKKSGLSGLVAIQGVLAVNNPSLEILRKAVANKEARRVDMGRLAGIDPDGASELAEILAKARRLDLAWGLSQADAQADRLAARLSAEGKGQESDLGFWKLLFELYHFLGREEDFEEKAVDYAIAFELSPPSWEPPKRPPVVPDASDKDKEAEPVIGADGQKIERRSMQRLEGALLQGKMESVQQLLKPGEENRLDFSGVSRIDFVSAGMLVNVLKAAGKATIVHPNRMVAELLRVMGVDQVAKVELSRY
ncbi:MAG: STAS domain-containing protein [Betaproteobacteria bacterium]|nr:STAS domain-containing protein [Betaproteobacteria bacterium]